MSGGGKIFDVHHGTITKPGRRLMHHVPLMFVKKKVAGGGRRATEVPLNLTSMIDFLMVVVIFLLSTFSASGEQSVPKEVKLPNARNVQELLAAPMVGVAGKDVYVDNKPAGSIVEALDAMEQDHEFLLKGDVFTKDAIFEWLDYKRTKELNPIRMRPTPHEFFLYFDI